MDIFKYIERRQLGFRGIGKSVHDLFIDQMGVVPSMTNDIDIGIGNTFACKFSRNKTNLHVAGCSSEHGEIIIQNTFDYFHPDQEIKVNRTRVHQNAIFNFAWAEPQMKLVTACGDQTSKLCSLDPSGKLVQEREFIYHSSVKSVMFCPGSSDVFCGGSQDGSIKIWDARMNNNSTVLDFDRNIPYAHALYGKKRKNNREPRRAFGVSSVIFKDDQTVISSSSMDNAIKVWDLRKSYRQVKMNTEPLPLKKYLHPLHLPNLYIGFSDIILNPQATHLYASCVNNVIYCFSLDSTERAIKPICQYTGYRHETHYSKISISNDGRYLFSGCIDQIGVLWLTNTPHIEKPVFKLCSSLDFKHELSSSDWCADSSCLKMIGSSDAEPLVLSVLTDKQRHSTRFKELTFCKTPMYTSKLYSKKWCTAPIKFDVEHEDKYRKQTEQNMENWFTYHHNSAPNVNNLQVTPKRPWDVLFTMKKSLSSSQMSPESLSTNSSSIVPNQISVVVTPTSSRKRKKSTISPRSLIDQYLVPNNKREKLDTVTEI